MLVSVLQLKLTTAMMSGWFAAASPMPFPAATMAIALDAHAASPVEVALLDGNRRVSATVVIERDGSTDVATTKQLARLFRCRSDREHALAPRTLAMLADLSERYGRPIEFVSGYRVQSGEPMDSPHRAARALDFRIPGIKLGEIRDYLWRTYHEVGVGYYPGEGFIHMDSRPHDFDTAWTFVRGTNHYKPSWADLARRPAPPVRRRPGV